MRLKGKSTRGGDRRSSQTRHAELLRRGVTIADGRVHTEMRELVVPPEKRILNVEVMPSQQEYKPGQKATVKVKLTDLDGKPFVGSTVVSVYDKSVEYISGGSNVPEIKEFFWKWRRHHYPQHRIEPRRTGSGNLLRRGEIGMSNLGVFGATGRRGDGQGDGKAERLRRRHGERPTARRPSGAAAPACARAGCAEGEHAAGAGSAAACRRGEHDCANGRAAADEPAAREPAPDADRPQELRRHCLLDAGR